mmetsp:Transcript_23847/g.67072  ORF Transcript_23847/g.67072 Transcript_23847/m.67072 type:complete len:268 (+) Transcript_23847:4466-5269(+)
MAPSGSSRGTGQSLIARAFDWSSSQSVGRGRFGTNFLCTRASSSVPKSPAYANSSAVKATSSSGFDQLNHDFFLFVGLQSWSSSTASSSDDDDDCFSSTRRPSTQTSSASRCCFLERSSIIFAFMARSCRAARAFAALMALLFSCALYSLMFASIARISASSDVGASFLSSAKKSVKRASALCGFCVGAGSVKRAARGGGGFAGACGLGFGGVASSFVRLTGLSASDLSPSNFTLMRSFCAPVTVPRLPLCSAAPLSEWSSTRSPMQ